MRLNERMHREREEQENERKAVEEARAARLANAVHDLEDQ